jgi:uncharacterized protein
MERDVLDVLRKDNPWLDSPRLLSGWLDGRLSERFIPRSEVELHNERWAQIDKAHLVVGPRQAGKSTAVWSHLVARREPVLFIDCEQTAIRAWCRSAPLFLAEVTALTPAPTTLLFEEVQHLQEAGLFLKGLVDRKPHVAIFVTGSSSYHLRARTRESLAGRATRTRLLPFSLAEVTRDLEDEPSALRQAHLEECFERHLVFGGYPETWLSESPRDSLTELAGSIVLPDASDMHRIGLPEAYRRLLKLLAGQVGSRVNISEWASVLGIGRETVLAYLDRMEDEHLVARISPFAGGRRSELTRRPKIYLLDNGLRNWLSGDLRPLSHIGNPGPLFENWVYTELNKALPASATLHYWRSTSGTEVNFIVAFADRLVAVEVKADPLSRPRLPRSCRSFAAAYAPARLVLVNRSLEHTERMGKTELIWTTPWRLSENVFGSFS